jgi:DNA-damage-inducible protein J
MGKTAFIKARIEPKLKTQARRVLAKVGLSTSDAIRMFMRQVVLQKDLPVEVRMPNAESRRAIAEVEAGRGLTFHQTTQEVFDSIRKPRKKRSSSVGRAGRTPKGPRIE